ncbi:hypothetical protein HYQ21_gp058 [Acinetobacter phage vB_AbaM_Apostate]|uniref:Uncharacterized protein n=1 Tax=Acinetobacter phage vB_AbaM_Apostate TaxID=2686308 RepID=A0A6B9J4Y7_9CAUD|nr:hypothetical protein HYQ21_gp058 [Acinetobacter phage vB_AbaM_Apostate]QGZ15649.1 hypothetical protein Apostate_058 [Acinetobacter phage vB_AbaM_Apostate]
MKNLSIVFLAAKGMNTIEFVKRVIILTFDK